MDLLNLMHPHFYMVSYYWLVLFCFLPSNVFAIDMIGHLVPIVVSLEL